jgi:hypothetical protein
MTDSIAARDESDTKFSDGDRAVLQDLYRLAISARDFEINQLVQRNNFFMIFQGVLFAGLLQAAGNGKIIPIISFLVSLIGLVISVLQVGMASGAKFWQERWEDAVETTEKLLVKAVEQRPVNRVLFEVFSSGDEHVNAIVKDRMKGKFLGVLVRARFSPSRIPIYAALAFSIIWALLISAQISGSFHFSARIVGFGAC